MECKICGKAKRIAARGMCGACYIRERRKAERGDAYIGRRPAGYHEAEAMLYASEWGKLFASKVDRSGDCHTWRGTLSKTGYGHFSFGGRTYLAHRLAFLLAGGESGMPVVMHVCDNPSCVNPAHLVGGTQAHLDADWRFPQPVSGGRRARRACLDDEVLAGPIEGWVFALLTSPPLHPLSYFTHMR